jgi:hypothetical protein
MSPPAPRECNQPAQRIASQTIRAPCSAAQRIASQPARSASVRASHPVLRSALHRILCSAAHRANATSPRAAHCIANNPRTENQPVTHRPPRPLCIARRTAHTSHLQLCTRFTVLCAGFVWFVVLTFPKFNLYTFLIQILV